MPLDVLVEALLFYKSNPQKISMLKKLFEVTDEEWQRGIDRLRARLEDSALRVVETDTEIQLVTAPHLAEFIEALRKDELKSDIGKAGAETLAIILYRGPIKRAEIDRIRGVNSSFILRNLLVRGLIERTSSGKSYTFSITPELLQHLGVERRETLPQFSEFMNAIDAFETTNHE